MVEQDQTEEIKQKIDIYSLVSSYVPLTKAGKNYKALCPFHSEKTPSFYVSPSLGIFKCFGCGRGGDAFTFVQEIEGISFLESLENLAERAGVKLGKFSGAKISPGEKTLFEINRLAGDYYHYLLTDHKVGAGARAFLKKREISPDSWEQFYLGYAPAGWDNLVKYLLSKNYTLTDLLKSGLVILGRDQKPLDFFRERVMFSLRSAAGKLIAFSGRTLRDDQEGPKYINIAATPLFEKRKFLYNFDSAKSEIRREQKAILVEGEFDVISLWQKGIRNVVGTKGTALTQDQVGLLSHHAQELIFCFDTDLAGQDATKRAVILSYEAGLEVKAVFLASGKDPDEAVREDEAAFKTALFSPASFFDYYQSLLLQKYDPASPSGKKALASEILPFIKSLSSAVEKEARLKNLAGLLEIDFATLQKEMEGAETLIAGPSPLPKKEPAYPKLEGYFLGLLFSSPADLLKEYISKTEKEHFSHEKLSLLFSQFKAYATLAKSPSLEKFRDKMEKDLVSLFEELSLAAVAVEDFGAELKKVSGELKRRWAKKRIAELSGEVRQAEKGGSKEKVKKLQRKILKLSEVLR